MLSGSNDQTKSHRSNHHTLPTSSQEVEKNQSTLDTETNLGTFHLTTSCTYQSYPDTLHNSPSDLYLCWNSTCRWTPLLIRHWRPPVRQPMSKYLAASSSHEQLRTGSSPSEPSSVNTNLTFSLIISRRSLGRSLFSINSQY
ncbi:hypothetical protein PGT21_019645 [Puccinia graminis f. sp. tritici]|uniref:Uncharacterized protein n=1 Tax=Puccinia graminis f. sp. tritici TaxID=56615 RepID=A0A5B0QNL0_PUCGR|nr:hypothetical protein PGT21_019645 [Puccinia graminis f. sp. tritici]